MEETIRQIGLLLAAAFVLAACSAGESSIDATGSAADVPQTFCEELTDTVVTVHTTAQSHTAELFFCYPDGGMILRHDSGESVFIREEVITHITFHEDDIPGMVVDAAPGQ